MIPFIQQRTLGYPSSNILLETQPTRSRATIFGTHGPCNIALDSHTTTPHHTSDGYPDGPRNISQGGQANPGCQELGWDVLSHHLESRLE